MTHRRSISVGCPETVMFVRALLVALAVLGTLAESVRACDMDAVTAGAAFDDATALARAANACDLGIDNPFTPLTYVRDFAGRGSCYSVAEIPAQPPVRPSAVLVLLKQEKRGGVIGLHRYESQDGGRNWTNEPTGPVAGPGCGNVPAPKCSDLQWSSVENKLVLYFNGTGGRKIVYAESYDLGRTFSGCQPVFWRNEVVPGAWDSSGIQNPSVIDVAEFDHLWVATHPDRRIILAYAGLHNSGTGMPPAPYWNGIGIAHANDWTASLTANEFQRFAFSHNDASTNGQAFTWDPSVPWKQTHVYRPRLVVNPATNVLYCFYVGVDRSQGTCQKVGYATSNDWGETWRHGRSNLPVFEGVNPPWDDAMTYCPDVIDPVAGVDDLWLYYMGATGDPDNTGNNELSILAAGSGWLAPPVLPGVGVDPVLRDAAETRSRSIVLTVMPNPSTHHVTLRLGRFLHFAAREGHVEIVVLDVHGRLVRSVWSGTASDAPAELLWDGTDEGGLAVASGKYAFVVQRGGEMEGSTWVSITR